MQGDVLICPACKGSGYDEDGMRCEMCRAKGKVEDGGLSPAMPDGQAQSTPYVGGSGYMLVVNLPPKKA